MDNAQGSSECREPGWWWVRHPMKGVDLVNVWGSFATNAAKTRQNDLAWWHKSGWNDWVGPFDTEAEAMNNLPEHFRGK